MPSLARALEGALQGYMTTVGIVPTRAETGYGYIEVGEDLAPGLSRVVALRREAGPRARAEAYVAGGKHLWNGGMFFFAARDVMAKAIATHLPDLSAGKLDAPRSGRGKGEESTRRSPRSSRPYLPSRSITASWRKASALAVVRGDFGWNDVGSWESAWELAPKGRRTSNALPDGSIAVDARGNLVRDPRHDRGQARHTRSWA